MSCKILPPTAAAITEGCALLRAGKPVALPTETVYGLAADATNDASVQAIYQAKGRPAFNPLIIHGADVAALEQAVIFSPLARMLAERFWPGPMTLVLPRTPHCPISPYASAGLNTLAVRIPAHPAFQAVLRESGSLLAAPSANRSGSVSSTTAQHVAGDFGESIPLVIDGGACPVGVESTIIDCTTTPPRILRHGAIAREALLECVPGITTAETNAAITAPGMLASHYAPGLPVRLEVTAPQADEALLAFGNLSPAGAKTTHNLSKTGDLAEAAANLYAALRLLDNPREYAAIAIVPLPHTGIGAALNDRLRRAAAPRG